MYNFKKARYAKNLSDKKIPNPKVNKETRIKRYLSQKILR